MGLRFVSLLLLVSELLRVKVFGIKKKLEITPIPSIYTTTDVNLSYPPIKNLFVHTYFYL